MLSPGGSSLAFPANPVSASPRWPEFLAFSPLALELETSLPGHSIHIINNLKDLIYLFSIILIHNGSAKS